MPRIALRLVDAKEMARAIVPHISRDDVTPALTVAALGGELGSFIYSTDRYSVGQYDLTNILIDGPPPEEMWIPRAALSWITTVGKASLMAGGFVSYTVVITTSAILGVARTVVEFIHSYNSEGQETHLLRAFSTPSHGNFPPMLRLFADFQAGEQSEVGLMPENLAKFTGYARYKNERLLLTLPAQGREKLKPILIQIGNRFRGLLMPTTLVGHQVSPPTPSSQDTDTTKEKEA